MGDFSFLNQQSANRGSAELLHAADALALLIAGIAIVIATAVAFPSLEQGSPCLWDTFNDQLNYLTAAQNLLREGRLQSDVLYPSLLLQDHPFAFLYMPGTPAVFAAAYWLLGHGMAAIITPGILAYLMGSLAVWYAATQIGGRFAGIGAGLLYLSFPMHVAFLHTAMTEQLLSAACALALALGCADKRHLVHWLAAAAVLAAVLLRETALAYFVILAGLLISRAPGKYDLRRLVAPVSGLFAGLGLVWYWAAGRPSLFAANLLADNHSATYFDAFAFNDIVVDMPTLALAMGDRLLRNTAMFFSSGTLNPEEYVVLSMMVLTLGFCLLRGAWRRDMFYLAIGLAGLVALALLAATYKIEFFKGSRFLAFLWPACCVALASLAPRLHSNGGGMLAILVIVSLFTSQSLSAKRAAVCDLWFAQAHTQEQFLQKHTTGKQQLLAAEDLFGLSWVLDNPGTKWSFLPSNLKTFLLLKEKAGVDLVVLAPGPQQRSMMERLQQEGFQPVDTIETNGGSYLLLKAESREATTRGHQVD